MYNKWVENIMKTSFRISPENLVISTLNIILNETHCCIVIDEKS